MQKKLKLYYKALSLLISLLLLFQSLAPGLFLLATTPSAFAQEALDSEISPTPSVTESADSSSTPTDSPVSEPSVSPTPTEEQVPTPTVTPTPVVDEASPSPSPTSLPTSEPSLTSQPTAEESTTPTSTPTQTPATEFQSTQKIDQTIQDVVTSVVETISGWQQNADGSYTTVARLGETYRYPGNDKVSLTFTRLPEQSGTLTIKEIRLTAEQIQESDALSDTAYDITSTMQNGTFEYNLILPRPPVSAENPPTVKFAENENNLENAQVVTEEKVLETETILIRGLNHFTVFLISANTTGGAYTSITSLTITEPAITQIGLGTIVLNVPSGFIFDTGSNVTATVTPSTCNAGGNTQVKLAGGLLTQTVTPTTTTITIDLTAQSTTNADCASTITFTGIKARPTAVAPVALGNITVTGTAALGTSTTSTETLQEIAAITAINTVHADGSFRSGEVIDITLTYTEAVTVNTGGGTPTIALNSGGTASYLSGSGTSTLTFRYTVGGSDSSADLAHSATNSLSLNGGTIRDGVNSGNADNTLPATSTFTGAHAIVIDNTAPVISSVSPANNAFINNVTTSSDISYTLDGNVASGVVTITRTSGAADGSSPHTCTLVGTALNSGAHTLNISDTTNGCSVAQTLVDGTIYSLTSDATDSAGNIANQVSRTGVTFDTTEPASATLSINSGAAYTNSTSVTLTISATDATSSVTEMNIYNGTAFNANNWEAYATSKSWTLPSTEGTKTVRARFRDAAGNENSTNLTSDTIILDTTAPSGSISAPSNNAYSNVNPSYTATASDTNGVASVRFQYKASTDNSYTSLNTDTGSPFAVDWTGVTLTTNTVYNLQIVITDVPGNTTTVSGTSFTFDTTAPNLTITSPVNGTTTTTTVSLNLTTNETTTCSYLLDSSSSGTFSTTGGTTHAHTFSGLGTGSHTLSIFCSDLAGNSTSSSTISWTVFVSSGSTIEASTTNPSFDSATDGQADLPSGITTLTLSDSTSLNLSGGISSATGGNVTVGGASIPLANFTSGNLSGVNLSTAQSIGGQSVSVNQAVKLESGTNGQPVVLSNTNLSNASVSIPDGATILAPSGWNGTIQPPKTSSTTGTSPSGFSFSGTTIEVGSPDVVLLFDTPVVLTFPTSSTIAYKSSGSSSWTQITNTCGGTYDSPTAPAFPGECAISNGSTTKVYTYHFTTFAAIRDNNTPSSTSQTCSDGKPGSAPTLLSAAAGNNQVTLTWSKAADPVSYYLVAYGTSSGTLQYGNPNIGGKDTTSFTVSNLSSGATYYFKVRAGNGCTPGDYSNELSATPSGETFEGIAIGFAPGVLGEKISPEKAKESKKEQVSEEEILGEESEEEKRSETLSKARTILPIVVVLLLLSGFGFWFFRKPR